MQNSDDDKPFASHVPQHGRFHPPVRRVTEATPASSSLKLKSMAAMTLARR
jgi:hypothetical protein